MEAGRVIAIVESSAGWPEAFEAIAEPLRQTFGDMALCIDHIGSTSVPGLPAKNVIDVQATVRSLDVVEVVAPALAQLGYMQRVRGRDADIVRDHSPAGWTGNPEEWHKRFFRGEKIDGHEVHLHVRVVGRANQRYPLLFRDYLRTHPAVAASYAEIKRQLARHDPNDWDLYYDVKDPVCDIIIAAAEAWAESSGWSV